MKDFTISFDFREIFLEESFKEFKVVWEPLLIVSPREILVSASTQKTWSQHIKDLTQQYGLSANYHDDPHVFGMARADLHAVWIPHIRSGQTYATALHEIGHVCDPDGFQTLNRQQASYQGRQSFSEVVLSEEHAAWRWAERNALEWTPEMEDFKRWCLKTYEER